MKLSDKDRLNIRRAMRAAIYVGFDPYNSHAEMTEQYHFYARMGSLIRFR